MRSCRMRIHAERICRSWGMLSFSFGIRIPLFHPPPFPPTSNPSTMLPLNLCHRFPRPPQTTPGIRTWTIDRPIESFSLDMLKFQGALASKKVPSAWGIPLSAIFMGCPFDDCESEKRGCGAHLAAISIIQATCDVSPVQHEADKVLDAKVHVISKNDAICRPCCRHPPGAVATATAPQRLQHLVPHLGQELNAILPFGPLDISICNTGACARCTAVLYKEMGDKSPVKRRTDPLQTIQGDYNCAEYPRRKAKDCLIEIAFL